MTYMRYNVWTCDICRKETILQEEVEYFLDVKRTQPKDWEIVYCKDKEFATCPECFKRDD